MSTTACKSRKANLLPGEFFARVIEVSGVVVRYDEEHCIGFFTAEKAAEHVGTNEIAFDGDEAIVLIEDHNGQIRRFKVVMHIQTTGTVTEVQA